MDKLLYEINEIGIIVSNELILDGKIHRLSTISHTKRKNGWYSGVMIDGKIFCHFGNWETGISRKFGDTHKNEVLITDQYQTMIAAAKIETEQKHLEAAKKAKKLIESLPPADDHHHYFQKKKIINPGIFQKNDLLIIPLFDKNIQIVGYQSIDKIGKKKYSFGMKRAGSFVPISGTKNRVYLCEGFATGVSINMATGNQVVCAMDSQNLLSVAEFLIEKYDNIIVCADNDIQTEQKIGENPGIKAAKNLQNKLGLHYIYPSGIKGSDFNDFVSEKSLDELKIFLSAGKNIEIFIEKKEDNAIPEELLNPPGVLKHIFKYYNETAIKEQPLFAIATGLILCSVVMGRRFKTQFKNYTSLYFIIAAKSGTGKDHVKQVCREMLSETNLAWLETGDGFTAANTVIKALESQPIQISFFEEIGQKLQEASANKRSLAHGMFRRLLDVWSSCHSFSVGEIYSDCSRPKVERPALTMVGITTPKALTNSINENLIEQGFVNRILPFISTVERSSTELRLIPEKTSIPPDIFNFIKNIWGQTDLSDAGVRCYPEISDEKNILFTVSAIKLLNEFEAKNIELAKKLEKINLDDMVGRKREIAMRVALIVAVAQNKIEINENDVAWSISLVNYCYRVYIKKIKRTIASSDYEKDKLDALNDLRRRGETGIRPAELPKISPWSRWPKKLRMEILNDLQESNLATFTTRRTGKHGPATSIWVAIK